MAAEHAVAKKTPAKKKSAKTATSKVKAKAKPQPKARPGKAKAAPKAKPAPASKASSKKPAPAVADAKSGRKGITIVAPKPVKKVKTPVTAASIMPPGISPLLDPKNPNRRPLIPSGPKAATGRALGQHGGPGEDAPKVAVQTHLSKKELEHFRQLLLRKRQELVGDVADMERAALQGGESGSLSNMPSHLADQGSDASEQSLSLDLAAADRKLIREIDDALKRIADGTYGVCELTGKPIKTERLEELPWARYSIEAARERERHAMRS